MGNKEYINKNTANFGETNPAAKLTAKRVKEIREKYAAGGTSYHKLAHEYGVSPAAIRNVVKRVYWQEVD